MKRHTQAGFVHSGQLALALALLTSCSSIPYHTGDPTAESLRVASRAVTTESRVLDETVAHLSNLVNSPGTDLKPQFVAFTRSRERLEDSVDRSDKAVTRLREQTAKYLEAWNEEIAAMNFEVIRAESAARRVAVSNQVHAVCQRYEETQAVVRPLIDYFSDIERSIGSDLTADGLRASADVVRRAQENARKVQMALGELDRLLSDSGARLSSTIAAGLGETNRPQKALSSSEVRVN